MCIDTCHNCGVPLTDDKPYVEVVYKDPTRTMTVYRACLDCSMDDKVPGINQDNLDIEEGN